MRHDMMLPLVPMAGTPSNVLDQSGLRVARCDFDGQWKPACDANAAYIIKCVNEHERLEAALRASTELVRLQDELLACYRIGRRPRVETLNKIGGLKVQIAANEAALKESK